VSAWPAGALDGVRVLDLTRYIPGPYCTMLLGDLGADVIKVEEPPVGDATRALPPAVGDDSAAHAALNRNKRSVLLDLRRPEGMAAVRRLAVKADVVVEAFRPGVLARRGLGYETLALENPRLVYCSVTGYGQEGPLAGRAGHDINYSARAGFLGSTRDKEGVPVLPLAQVGDMAGGFLATIGVLAALLARERTGRGQLVDVSMLQGLLAFMTLPATRLLAGAPRADELAGTQACYGVYRCRDGRYLSVGALEPKFWEALCEGLGRPELAPRQWDRGARGEEMQAKIAEVFAGRDRETWISLLAAREVCVEPVLDVKEALAQPEVMRFLMDQPTGAGATLRTVAPPVRLADTPASVRRGAPVLGEHTDEVLREAGFSAEEIDHLRRTGAAA
jgi:crotonobetainyl-CoA:carnitine CoA-transferase CaiB-like acyl-CoA transferase